MALSLYSGDCSSTAEANELFASEKGLLLLRPGGGCSCTNSFFFTVPSGCYALVTRYGADMDYAYEDENGKNSKAAVWPAGIHYFYPPWIGVSYLVTKQSIVLDLPVKACKTKDNVTVNIDMSLVFRIMGDESLGEDPELVRNFVYAVKPKGLEQQLRDAQEEVIRSCARSLRHTEIYGIRSGGKISDEEIGDEEDSEESVYRDPIFEGSSDTVDKDAAMKSTKKGQDVAEIMRVQLNRQFEPQGISIQSVMIKSVTLPEDIRTQMSDKTMVMSQNAAQRMHHEHNMQNNRMLQKEQTLMQTFDEQREQERSDGAQRVNGEEVKLNDMKSEARKMQAYIFESARNEMISIAAESGLKVQRVEDEMDAAVSQMRTEAEKEAAELLATTNLEVQTLLASSEITRAQNVANAELLISLAEGKIAPWIEKKKAYETQMKEVDVYKNLARNDKLILNGSNDDVVNLIAVADSILSDTKDEGKDEYSERSRLMAEMSIMRAGASDLWKKSEISDH